MMAAAPDGAVNTGEAETFQYVRRQNISDGLGGDLREHLAHLV